MPTINVTQEHIDHGILLNSSSCPVAMAVRAAGFTGANVHAKCITYQGWNYTYPRSAQAFVKAFDQPSCRTCEIEPFSFEFDTTSPV
jgi:hypothetical protein